MASARTSAPSSTAARLAALETGQSATRDDLHKLSTAFDRFADEMRRDRRTPWGAIGGIAGAAVAFAVAIVSLGASGPLRDLERLDKRLDVHGERFDTIRSNRFTEADGLDLEARLTAAIERLRDTEAELRGEILPRGEAGERFSELRQLIQALESRVDRHLDDGHPARVEAVVDGLKARVDLLEREHRRGVDSSR